MMQRMQQQVVVLGAILTVVALVLLVEFVYVSEGEPRHRSPRAAPVECARPRGARGLKTRTRGNKHPVYNVTEQECAKNVRWGDGLGGWDAPPPEGEPSIALGQNLEDVAVLERFFRRGPVPATGGVFVEMGAFNGVTFSNTLALEHCLGWTGLLIEANPENYEQCRRNRPCVPVHHGGACMPPKRHILIEKHRGGSSQVRNSSVDPALVVPVPCRPMSEILRKHGLTRINFFSLDVEGSELEVLKTVDWGSVAIDVLIVETTMIMGGRKASAEVKAAVENRTAAIRRYLNGVGMTRVPSALKKPDVLPSGHKIRPMFMSVSGSDVYVGNKELLAYDRRLH